MSVGSAGCWLGPSTLTLAEAVLPVPPSVEVTAVVTLFCIPAVMPVTFTAKLQVEFAASVASEKLTLVAPAAAEIVPPPQLPDNPLGVEMTKPAGNVSVKPTPLRELLAFGLERVKVSEVPPLICRLAAPKAFEIVGGSIVGGGCPLPDEPPPQPEMHARPRTIAAENGKNLSCVSTLQLLRESGRRQSARGEHSRWDASLIQQQNGCSKSICLIEKGNPTKVGLGLRREETLDAGEWLRARKI